MNSNNETSSVSVGPISLRRMPGGKFALSVVVHREQHHLHEFPHEANALQYFELWSGLVSELTGNDNEDPKACAEALYEALCGIDGARQVSECMRDFFRQQTRIAEQMLRHERIEIERLKGELADAIATQGLAEAERKLWIDEAERRSREFEQRSLEQQTRTHGTELFAERLYRHGLKVERILNIIRENRCGMPLAVLQALDEYDGVEATQCGQR